MTKLVRTTSGSAWAGSLFGLFFFLNQNIYAQSDFTYASVYSPKYEQTMFAAFDPAVGQLQYMWTSDKKWVKLGQEINTDGKMSLSFAVA